MVMDIEGLETYSELILFLRHGDFTELTFTEEKVELSEAKPVYLPDGFKLITQGTSTLANSFRKYVIKRGFQPEALARHGVGYCTKGEYFGYLIIPFYTEGNLRYWNARLVIGSGPRYNNPPKDITGLGKEFLIYNSDALGLYNQVFICEGAINALTMGENAIATMGKAVSRYQINSLIKSQSKRFILLLDPDAKDKAIDLALKLVNFKSVKVVYLPEGKDCNDIGRKEVMKLVWATRYQDYQDLIKLKNEL
jgi:DNA primase